MNRLGTFDEMLGCNGCNMIHHRDTRRGPFIQDEDGETRKPISMRGLTKTKESTCKKQYISGSKDKTSISFEGGPFTSESFPEDGNPHQLW